nr:hypothetical protein [Tanacetum cinerariifolium]
LPVLAGAAGGLGDVGALGTSYCSPYITIDGAYNARSSGQASSLAPSSDMKPSQRPGCNAYVISSLAMISFGPALSCGCTVVKKPYELTLLTALVAAKLALRAKK